MVRGERGGGAEQSAESATVLTDAGKNRHRNVDVGGANASEGHPVGIDLVAGDVGVVLKLGRAGRCDTGANPAVERANRGAQNVGVRTGVDGLGALDDPHVHRRGCAELGLEEFDVGLTVALLTIVDAEAVRVTVRGAGHFPIPEHVGVGLLGAPVPERGSHHVGLGDEVQHRTCEILADTHDLRGLHVAGVAGIGAVRRAVEVRRP